MAEDLSEYYQELGVKVRYLHSDVDTLERIEILRDLRRGVFDVLIGINLLREGLDLPEVSLVAIFDADKEGFLRSEQALIQTIGRAARNVNGQVLLYADVVTRSMQRAIEATEERRRRQAAYNKAHDIVPRTVKRNIFAMQSDAGERANAESTTVSNRRAASDPNSISAQISALREQMLTAAKAQEYEEAALCRDAISRLRQQELAHSGKQSRPVLRRKKRRGR